MEMIRSLHPDYERENNNREINFGGCITEGEGVTWELREERGVSFIDSEVVTHSY